MDIFVRTSIKNRLIKFGFAKNANLQVICKSVFK